MTSPEYTHEEKVKTLQDIYHKFEKTGLFKDWKNTPSIMRVDGYRLIIHDSIHDMEEELFRQILCETVKELEINPYHLSYENPEDYVYRAIHFRCPNAVNWHLDPLSKTTFWQKFDNKKQETKIMNIEPHDYFEIGIDWKTTKVATVQELNNCHSWKQLTQTIGQECATWMSASGYNYDQGVKYFLDGQCNLYKGPLKS